MENYPELNLADVFKAIENDIKKRFPSLVNVVFFPDEPQSSTQMPVPACLLDVSEMEVDLEVDPGTEQLPVRLSFSAFMVISAMTDGNTKLQIRLMAAALVSFLKFRHWVDHNSPGTDNEPNYLPSDPAIPVGAYRDDFTPGMDRFEVWRVDWEQVFYFGKSVFDTSFLPSRVWLGLSPDIGEGKESEYTELNNG